MTHSSPKLLVQIRLVSGADLGPVAVWKPSCSSLILGEMPHTKTPQNNFILEIEVPSCTVPNHHTPERDLKHGRILVPNFAGFPIKWLLREMILDPITPHKDLWRPCLAGWLQVTHQLSDRSDVSNCRAFDQDLLAFGCLHHRCTEPCRELSLHRLCETTTASRNPNDLLAVWPYANQISDAQWILLVSQPISL